jgi:uncharacterized protein YndB with AHSA1/START domain/dihydrofolate reductase
MTNSKSLTVTKLIHAAPAKVFAAWITPEIMNQWFCPAGLTIVDSSADPRVGGAYHIVMKDDRAAHTVRGSYREIVVGKKLVFTHRWDEPEAVDTLVTVDFVERDGSTEITLTQRDFRNDESRRSHAQGWQSTLERLDNQLVQTAASSRKLILQVQISLDGYVADKQGTTEPMLWNWGPDWIWDRALQQYHTDLIESADVFLLSRRMGTEGFISFWADVAQKAADPRVRFARHITHGRKLVFSKRLQSVEGENTFLTHNDLKDEVDRLKREPGKNLVAWGGASFVSSLIAADLVDEYHLVTNPLAFGGGLPIFDKLASPRRLSLLDATAYSCGIVLSRYERAR